MKQTIGLSQFQDAFERMGRADNFSYEGMELLFDYLEELDPDAELDVVAICCEYAENTPETIAQDYSINIEGLEESEILDIVTDYLNENTSIIGTTDNGSIVYAQF
jgi:hypothetical protein